MRLTLPGIRPNPNPDFPAKSTRFPAKISVVVDQGTVYYVSPPNTATSTYRMLTGAEVVPVDGYKYVRIGEESVEMYGRFRTKYTYERRALQQTASSTIGSTP